MKLRIVHITTEAGDHFAFAFLIGTLEEPDTELALEFTDCRSADLLQELPV